MPTLIYKIGVSFLTPDGKMVAIMVWTSNIESYQLQRKEKKIDDFLHYPFHLAGLILF